MLAKVLEFMDRINVTLQSNTLRKKNECFYYPVLFRRCDFKMFYSHRFLATESNKIALTWLFYTSMVVFRVL